MEDNSDIERATIVRLGSTTHGFDMSQRFVELGVTGSGTSWTVTAPEDLSDPDRLAQNIAPPGYYMLFLISEDGEPSEGHYIKVGPNEAMGLKCVIKPAFSAYETACTVEPQAGACPPGGSVTTPIKAPLIAKPLSARGWEVFAPIDVIHDSSNPTAEELAAVEENLCVAACEAHFADIPGASANCAQAEVFKTPTINVQRTAALDLVRQADRNGAGIFAGQQLSCDLGIDCYTEFDEILGHAVPQRVTPADAMLSKGEEYRVALGPTSTMEIVTDVATFSTGLTGSVGYSSCTDGHGSAPCAFYLGSLDAVAVSAMVPKMTCDDGTIGKPILENLQLALSQPAFGIAEQGSSTIRKGFPPGGLVVDTTFDVDGEHFTTRRPNRATVTVDADDGTFSASNLAVTMRVPCNNSMATITALLDLEDPGSGPPLESPPSIQILNGTTVTCGQPTTLAASASDPDGDLDEVRWVVDGVLIDAATNQLTFTGPHTLEAFARDDRGATSTDRIQIQCG